jgi:hypothetical protein
MKFFTPDLLFRFGSEDDATADAANEEWERANDKYLQRLQKIRHLLPRGARSLLRNHCLHDARVVMLGVPEGHRVISLLLELDTPRDQGLLLRYDLQKPPALLKHAELAEIGTPLEWLYDEFDVAKPVQRPVFTHSILFTGGRELRLTFRNLLLTPFAKVLVPAVDGDERDIDSLLATA